MKNPLLQALTCAVASIACGAAFAFTVNIGQGTRAIYLQVGNGSFTGTYVGGGTPGNNSTTNVVSVTVPASVVGTGAAQQMTSDSTQAVSFYSNATFCNPPVQVYVGGFYRRPGNSGNSSATLSVTTAANLVNASGDTIPFTQIGWTSSGIGDVGAQPIPAGTFVGGTQTLATFVENTWSESCHTFSYANAANVPPGTYNGRATYTLATP